MSYSYNTPEGYQVMTSEFLKKKGTCCKSTCLHCPYGHTIKIKPVQFHKYSDETQNVIRSIFDEAYNKDDVTSSLLGSAFGTKKKELVTDHYFLLTLKGFECGVAEVVDGSLRSFYLTEHFRDQGINESYLMSLLV